MEKNIKRFTWVPFYEEFARKLLEYKDNRKELVEKVKKAFGDKLSKNSKGEFLDNIDPFSIFSNLTFKFMTDDGPSLFSDVKKVFGLNSEVPKYFHDLPTPNHDNVWYVTEDFNSGDIEVLWELFECVLNYQEKDRERFEGVFNSALKVSGCGIKKLADALFWISSDKFANYNCNNRDFLYEGQELPTELKDRLPNLKKKPNAQNYLLYVDILKEFIELPPRKYDNLRELYYAIYRANKNKITFQKWMKTQISKKNDYYKDKTISNYVNVLSGRICRDFQQDLDIDCYNLFLIGDSEKYENIRKQIVNSPNFDAYNESTSNRTPNAALEAYSRFLKGEENSIRYWTFSPGLGACMWEKFYSEKVMGIGWTGVDNLHNYHSKDEIQVAVKERYGGDTSHMNDILALWQIANDVKVGDIIFVKTGSDVILGKGKVTSEYFYDRDNYPDYPHLCQVEWINKGLWHVTKKGCYFASKALTDISNNLDMVTHYNALIGGGSADEYGKKEFLNEVFMDETRYNELVDILEHKKNLILQGAPGVGKTFAAKRLAYSMMGKKDDARIEMVQFHQNYSYEDFVMGYKPDDNGFVLKEGIFYNFCEKAKNDHGNKYFFIIDEINRGNLSKIFGELMMLIENDWRGHEIKLAYKDVLFSVPDNLYIIGMMNTADRSLAMIDYALRRRFSFFTLEPAFASDGFIKYKKSIGNDMLNDLLLKIEKLNKDIVSDESLGRGFQIGHSYFCGMKAPEDCTKSRLKVIVQYDILPTLEEYWFDDQTKLSEWKKELEIL